MAASASSESFQTAVSSGKGKDTFGKIKLLTVQLRKKTLIYCGYYHYSVNHLQPFLFTLFTLVFFHTLVLVDQ